LSNKVQQNHDIFQESLGDIRSHISNMKQEGVTLSVIRSFMFYERFLFERYPLDAIIYLLL